MRREGRHAGPSQRQLRVGEEIRHALANVFERGEVHDPGLAGLTVTVSEVRVSPDLRTATAYVIPLGGSGTETMMGALSRAQPYLRRRVAAAVRLKYAPDLVFRPDASFDEAKRIDDLLRTPGVRRDLDASHEIAPATEPGESDDGA